MSLSSTQLTLLWFIILYAIFFLDLQVFKKRMHKPATNSATCTSASPAPSTHSHCGDGQVIFQRHQILRLPPTMALMVDPRHICNVIYSVRSNTGTLQHHLHLARKITLQNFQSKTAATSITMRGRSDHVPRPFQAWNQGISRSRGHFSNFDERLRLPREVTLP